MLLCSSRGKTAQLALARGLCGLLAVVFMSMAPLVHAATNDQRRAEVRTMEHATLDRLYRLQPGARAAIAHAAGYAVFSNFGMKILVAGGGTGRGIAVDNATKKETFMKMVEVQAGLGFGVKTFRVVWVFQTPQAFQNFVDSGWEFGAQTTAAATLSGQGASVAGALSVSPDVWVYQLTSNGIALELTAKGTKYFKDNDLNM